jgi:hypothetical protein
LGFGAHCFCHWYRFSVAIFQTLKYSDGFNSDRIFCLPTTKLAKAPKGWQAAWNSFAKVVLPHIDAGENEMLICGMSLGYADETDKVNAFDTPRLPVEQFCRWLD